MNTTIKITLYTLIATMLSLPVFLFAADESQSLTNPLIFNSSEDENGIALLIEAIVNIFQIILLPIVVLLIMYAGFMYVTARGNPEAIKRASQALVYALIGGVIIIGAEFIGLIVQNIAGGFSADS